MAEFVRFRADPEKLAQIVGETTLSPTSTDVYYERVLFSLGPDGMRAPARSRSPAVYTAYEPAFFESYEVTRPGYVVLATVPTLRWLEWLEDESVTVVFGGDPDGNLIEWAEIRAEEQCITAEPLPTDVAVDSIDLGMPAVFDEDGRFAPDGTPAPTRVETDAATLERLVAAADIVDGDGIPVVVSDGEFRLAVSGRVMASDGTLSASSVDGPDCRNWYGPELGAITRTLAGSLALEIVPDGSMAIVQADEHAARRYTLSEQL